MSSDKEYLSLLDITAKISNINININNNNESNDNSNSNNKNLNLYFDDNDNKLEDFMCFDYLKNSIKLPQSMSLVMNEYLLGLMFKYISLDSEDKNNVKKLITFYNFSLELKYTDKFKNTNPSNIKYVKNMCKNINSFLTDMNEYVCFDIKNDVYNYAKDITKVFIINVKIILDKLLNDKLHLSNINNYMNCLHNLFIMLLYILIKNPL